VLGLEEIERPEPEMDPMCFGILIHEALEGFATSDAKDSPDVERIRESMLEHLGRVAGDWFGSSPALAVRVQLEMARARLKEVANWQAGWRAQGWKIVGAEVNPKGGVELPGLDKPFRIRGKIDRIDRHEDKGTAILDYKTGETVEGPERTHGGAGKWKDLQLPLYRHLAGLTNTTGKLTMGYVTVPSSPSGVQEMLVDWSDADLADADAKAREIVEKVRRGEFFDLGKKPPDVGTFAAIAGTAFATTEKPLEGVEGVEDE